MNQSLRQKAFKSSGPAILTTTITLDNIWEKMDNSTWLSIQFFLDSESTIHNS